MEEKAKTLKTKTICEEVQRRLKSLSLRRLMLRPTKKSRATIPPH